MIIQQERIHVKTQPTKINKFIVERVMIPENLSGLRIKLLAEANLVEWLLVYDTTYNLRAEMNDINGFEMLVIHESPSQTSSDAKSGAILPGEWLLAFEISDQVQVQTWNFSYLIEGIKKDLIIN